MKNLPFNIFIYVLLSISNVQMISIKNLYETKLTQFDSYPEQIHLSYGSRPDQMTVTWVTLDYVNETAVEYGIDDLKNLVMGTSEEFVDGGTEKRKINIHRVILSGLLPNQTYSKRKFK
jgi:hypothetical protein